MVPEPDLVILANVVSRVEALCLADMLDAEGIPVLIQGYHHATVLVIPLGLGGMRIWVPRDFYEQAAALVRETGFHEAGIFSRSLQRAAAKVAVGYGGLHLVFAAYGFASGVLPAIWLVLAPLSAMTTVPVSPQSRGEYFLEGEGPA